MDALKPLLAAGGVVVRPGPSGPEVLLVHRPRYDDWSLPKGKLKRDEHPLLGALREIEEETSLRVRPGAALPMAEYPAAGTIKRVFYWAMTVVDDSVAAAAHEVDRVAWLPVAEAIDTLTYDHDRPVVKGLHPTGPPVLLVRASRHAASLAPVIAAYRPTRLVCAPSPRCREALASLRLGRTRELDPSFDEAVGPWAAAQRLRALGARDADVTVVVARRATIDAALAQLTGPAHGRRGSAGCVLTFSGADRPPSVDPLDP